MNLSPRQLVVAAQRRATHAMKKEIRHNKSRQDRHTLVAMQAEMAKAKVRRYFDGMNAVGLAPDPMSSDLYVGLFALVHYDVQQRYGWNFKALL